MTDSKIPTRGEWRGVPLHDDQSEARLVAVRRDIDDAHALRDVEGMVEFAEDVGRAPEARIYARLKALAYREAETERRAPQSLIASASMPAPGDWIQRRGGRRRTTAQNSIAGLSLASPTGALSAKRRSNNAG